MTRFLEMIYKKLEKYIRKKYKKKKKIFLHEPVVNKYDFLSIKNSLAYKQLSTHGNLSDNFSNKIKKYVMLGFVFHLIAQQVHYI